MRRDSEVENQSVGRDKVSSALESFRSWAKGLSVVREANIPRRLVGTIRTTQEEMVVWGGGIPTREQYVEHREPSEDAVNVTLTRAPFWVEGDLLKFRRSLEGPITPGLRGRVLWCTRLHQGRRVTAQSREELQEALPAQWNEGLGYW